MAQVEERTTEQVRREIELEREQLATAVDSLREGGTALARLPLACGGERSARGSCWRAGSEQRRGCCSAAVASADLSAARSTILKQAGQQFMADDCMGLAQQVAYSSLLAFFPAVAFLLGLLGIVRLYDEVESLLAHASRRTA